jgi:hypothetical protein
MTSTGSAFSLGWVSYPSVPTDANDNKQAPTRKIVALVRASDGSLLLGPSETDRRGFCPRFEPRCVVGTGFDLVKKELFWTYNGEFLGWSGPGQCTLLSSLILTSLMFLTA